MRKAVVVAAVTTAAMAAAVAVLWSRWKQESERQWRKTRRILRKFARDCATPVSKLWLVADALVSDMNEALTSQETTTLNMPISYVASLPSGPTSGKNESISELHREEVSIPSNVMGGTSQELFDYIALELAKFISEHEVTTDDTPDRQKALGFIVSYPVDQAAASSGAAIKWKSFSVTDTAGKALASNFNRALEKHGVNLRVLQLVEDAIGHLAGGRYYNRDTVAAITLGMATTAAYVEPTQAVPEYQSSSNKSSEMVISMDWGNFNSCHLPITEFDTFLDAESSNPGSRIFEKLTSGMYLGEIVRRVLLKMAQETALFGEDVPPKLRTPYLLRSPDMAAMHQDTSEDHEVVHEKLMEIFRITNSTPLAREVVAEVCDIVAERGARLAGAGIVGITKKLGRIENKRSAVTVEGGLYEHYRVFRNYMHSSVWEMLGNELSDNVVIEHSHGGSGAGAIFLAASQTNEPNS
ncbi:putative hexokinase-like 2 protein [Vitis vinifera]|uniref:Phosphotransferase n=1 Tax=Vitis vinifera TaxID=29760 RepID=A0A438KRW0_VITVI|nr:putative hexokinase-like 2 protein [Vitis vinifera]